MVFKVIIEEDVLDGGYNASCPALPGCHSQGDTVEDAVENIKDAIEGCLFVLNKRAKRKTGKEKVLEVSASWQS